MALDFDAAPADCQAAIREIQNIARASRDLGMALALAVTISPLPARASALTLLWRLGFAGKTYGDARKAVAGTLGAVMKRQVRQIIEAQMIRHVQEAELYGHWKRMKAAYQ